MIGKDTVIWNHVAWAQILALPLPHLWSSGLDHRQVVFRLGAPDFTVGSLPVLYTPTSKTQLSIFLTEFRLLLLSVGSKRMPTHPSN